MIYGFFNMIIELIRYKFMKNFFKIYFSVHWRKKIRYLISLFISILSLFPCYILSLFLGWYISATYIETNVENSSIPESAELCGIIIFIFLLSIMAILPIIKLNSKVAQKYYSHNKTSNKSKICFIANLTTYTFFLIIFAALMLIVCTVIYK